ncbi:MAG: asparaginase [Clostridia bacterium]|nr:asparaginase [Clostridia bacterium]
MKKILLIATGGTIASVKTETGLTPEITSKELLKDVPEIGSICEVDTVQLFNLDSTNMCYRHWLALVREIKEKYDLYDGFVITHGTDTMAYAVATVSYLIQGNGKPIVFTGSQKSIADRDSDARNNLRDAFLYAVDDRACGVKLVFDGKVILGTRARKTRTKSFNAFSSVDFPEAARFLREKLIVYLPEARGEVKFYDRLDASVFVLRLIPGMDGSIFPYLAEHYHAVVIESFGVGGIPFYEDADFADGIEKLVLAGVKVIVTTQVPHEGSDMMVYRVGAKIKRKYELVEAYDMTIESVTAKTMWALCQPGSFREHFYRPVAKDIF